MYSTDFGSNQGGTSSVGVLLCKYPGDPANLGGLYPSKLDVLVIPCPRVYVLFQRHADLDGNSNRILVSSADTARVGPSATCNHSRHRLNSESNMVRHTPRKTSLESPHFRLGLEPYQHASSTTDQISLSRRDNSSNHHNSRLSCPRVVGQIRRPHSGGVLRPLVRIRGTSLDSQVRPGTNGWIGPVRPDQFVTPALGRGV